MRKFAILFVICAISFAAVSRSLPYSGRLTDATGTSVNDDVSISFSIYDVATGGTALWTDVMTVTVVNGQFSVVLGDTDGDGTIDLPIGLSFDTPYFLEMTVEGETMTPREILAPSAYAHRSVYADTADYARGMSTTEATSAYSVVTGDVYHVCAGEDLQMNGQYSGGAEPYTHLWTGDTGPLAATDIPNPAFNTSTAGVYNLLYKLTDDDGINSYQTMTVIVHALPTPTIAASPASGGCEGEPVVLSGDGCFKQYCWNPGGPCSKVFNATESGTFEMTVVDQWGCQATVSHSVSFLEPPVANAGSNLAECYGGTNPTLGGTPAATGGTPPYFYEWTGSGLPYVSSPNAPNPTFDVSSASSGIYNVSLEVTDANGCTDEDGPIVITVYDNPVANASATSPVCPGDVITLSGGATGGTSPYSFSWTGPSGFTSFAQNPSIAGASSAHAGTYSLTVTDAHGCVSAPVNALVAINDPPTITVPPPSQTICESDDVTFSVTATGTSPLTYQWQRNIGIDWSDLSGATSSSLTLSAVPLSFNGYQHRCVVSGACTPDAVSTASTLTVNAAPVITSHPISTTVCNGDDHTFSVTATGYSLTYQWERNTGSGWAGISGATSATLDLTGINTSMDGYLYRCVVTGGCSPAVTSTAASLTVLELPNISSHPADIGVDEGDPASFGVTATGDGISYQWQQSTDSGSSWADISGATSNTYNIGSTTLSMNGYQFRCIVSGTCPPAATSTEATLSVASHGSVTYTYTGSIGNWTVPLGVTSITIECWGAQGGGGLGGLGARMRGTVTVTPGETIKYLVGAQGTYSYGGGGGGGSFTTRADNSPLVIAGGGGGQNYASAGGTAGRTETTGGSIGSAAGGSSGGGGAHGTGDGGCGWYGSGGGGLTGNGGVSGDGGGNSFVSGAAASVNPSGNCVSAGLGGFGGGGSGGNGGGGGGGYSGGAGGLNESGYTGGCGGGSYNAGTAQSNSAGVRASNGQITITW